MQGYTVGRGDPSSSNRALLEVSPWVLSITRCCTNVGHVFAVTPLTNMGEKVARKVKVCITTLARNLDQKTTVTRSLLCGEGIFVRGTGGVWRRG